MTVVRQPLLSPIKFHNPSMEFDNEINFQNPDNRLSTSYDWENVRCVPYALPIPKVWPDGQPGIDFMLNTAGTLGTQIFYADLYDANDEYYKSLYVHEWQSIDSGNQYHVWLDGLSGTGIEDGYYTIKIFAFDDDELLLESEMLLIADWFIDAVPLEFWNFENDFGIVWSELRRMFTTRIMAPIRIYDPGPQFEKQTYQNDPGILTTLRTIPQRMFNFDSHPIPVHVAELIQLGFGCSEIYLDRIKINSEEIPDAEIYEGTNLKYLSGQANFVDWNQDYVRELVDTVQEDQNIDWYYTNYDTALITGDSVAVNDPVIASGPLRVECDALTLADGDMWLFRVEITDGAGDSDLPMYEFQGEAQQIKEWGTHWFFFRLNGYDSTDKFQLYHNNGQKAVYTAVIQAYKIV
jgi:hypothetical protein